MAISNELKQAIQREVEASVKIWNDSCDGRHGGNYGRPSDRWLLHKSGVKVEDCKVTMNGEKIATIRREYYARKINLCYKQKKATIEWEDAA